MATTQRPSPSDLNTELLVAEAVPGQVREIQRKLRELEQAKARHSATLNLLVQFALAAGIDLFPVTEQAIRPRNVETAGGMGYENAASNGNAASPGGADGATVRGEANDLASDRNITPLSRTMR